MADTGASQNFVKSVLSLSESQYLRTMKKMGMPLKKYAQIPVRAAGQLQLDFYKKELLPKL